MAVDQVIEALEQLAEVHERLIELAHTKKAAIMANDIEALSRTTAAEAKCIARITELDRQREEGTVRALAEQGMSVGGEVTISRLYGVVFNPGQRTRLQQAEARLRERLDELKRLNGLNQQLLQQSIDFVQFSIELLTPQPDDDYIYRNPAAQGRDYMRAGFYNQKV